MTCRRWFPAGHHYHIVETVSRCTLGILTHWRLVCCRCGRPSMTPYESCMAFSVVVWPHHATRKRVVLGAEIKG